MYFRFTFYRNAKNMSYTYSAEYLSYKIERPIINGDMARKNFKDNLLAVNARNNISDK